MSVDILKRIEEELNAVGLSLVMSGGDLGSAAKEEIRTHLFSAIAEASREPTLGDLVSLLEAHAGLLDESDGSTLLKQLEEMCAKAQSALRDPQSLAKTESSRAPHPDVSESFVQDLLVEFIEKHTGGLEEFEGMLLDPEHGEGNSEEVQRAAKGYIHNLKGDAGSIGLIGIERVCHQVEEMVLHDGIAPLMEQLIGFREWVGAWLKALSHQSYHGESADEFLARTCRMVPSQKVSDLLGIAAEDLSNANLDLLAELLSEESVKKEELASPRYEISGDKEVLIEFANEAEEHLSVVETTLLETGANVDKEGVDAIFRGIHSIKGASSYFKLLETTETAHLTESILDEVRSGKRSFDQPLVELVLEFVDLQRRFLTAARHALTGDGWITRVPESADYLTRLKRYQEGGAVASPAPLRADAMRKAPENDVAAKGDERSVASEQGKGERLDIKNYVKVETERLDQLIDSIGEMAIYSSMLIQGCREAIGDDEHLIKVTHQVEKFSRELQHIGMSMRLIPIRGLFQKMSRLVWDVARKIGKEVKFAMEGEETELDRIIIEKLADPLMHMIRNAIDHGVEPPDERVASGKARAGSIQLKAFHSGGNIHIQIVDDGRGLNPEKLIKKAREKGIISEGQRLTDNEAFHLIFAAGFSTAESVTDISGRGVGMDVVRRNIESMRGRVHIDSRLGQGTVFTIELPLTLAIIDGIELRVGREHFIVPTLSVVEFMKPEPSFITRTLDRGETFHFRGRYLPVYRLGDLFDVGTHAEVPEEALYVVVEVNGEQFTVMVDEIVSTHSTVIKSVGEMFAQSKGIAGCAIMPNGDVALILDLRSLLEFARAQYRYGDSESPARRQEGRALVQ